MHRRHVVAVSAVLVSLVATSASAQTAFFANLTGAQENPPALNPTLSVANGSLPRPMAFGSASLLLNAAQTSLSFTATVFNIDFTGSQTADVNDNLTAAHIHASATLIPTMNAGVVFGFFGTPFNDNNPNDVVFTPFLTGVGGTISGKWDALAPGGGTPEGNNTTLTAQLPNIFAGRSYINFHTRQFGGGEVRGAITLVPEPATVVLLASGLVAVGAIGWRRRKN